MSGVFRRIGVPCRRYGVRISDPRNPSSAVKSRGPDEWLGRTDKGLERSPMVLLISYDLNREERPSAYEAVRRVIESNARSAVRPLYSQWWVETDESPDIWQRRLLNVMDSDDKLLINRMRPHPDHQGWLSQEHWDWLNRRV